MSKTHSLPYKIVVLLIEPCEPVKEMTGKRYYTESQRGYTDLVAEKMDIL